MKATIFLVCVLAVGWMAMRSAVHDIPPVKNSQTLAPTPPALVSSAEMSVVEEMKKSSFMQFDLARDTVIVPSAATWNAVPLSKRKALADLSARYWYDAIARPIESASPEVPITPRIKIEDATTGHVLTEYNPRDGFHRPR